MSSLSTDDPPGRPQGVFVKLPSVDVIDLLAASRFSFAIVDLEHSGLTEADALRLVRHGYAIGFPAIVRIPALDRGLINRLLEQGARGIQLSTVRTVDEARELVRATRYHPDGARSISLGNVVAGYGAEGLREYVSAAKANQPLAIVQIETAETVDPLPDILATGVDIAFIGMADLAVSLGFDAERLQARVEEIAEAAAAAGVVLGAANCSHSDVQWAADHADLGLLRGAL
jgi:4-hydroxy-2-oxoheptanedioate aldolase